jgi:hypothetical protein
VAIAVAGALAGVRDSRRTSRTLPAARRLAADVAVLRERPAAERPRVEVVTGPAIDAVLAWYLRDVPIAWVASADEGSDETPALVLVSTTTKRDSPQPAQPGAAPRYAIAADRDTLHLVELR